MTKPATAAVITVPATSANLGPGFDCPGLAVNLHLTVRAELSDSDHFHYSGSGSLPAGPDNLLHQGYRAALQHAGHAALPVTFHVENPIPLARGMGSSSAALIAGMAAADAFTGGRLGRDGVFQLAASIEGHPDNAAPAVYGGFTVSAADGDCFTTRSLPLPAGWRYLFAIPPFELPTETARALLPASYPRADVIHSASRTALWALAVATDDPALLRLASQDVLHQPYRAPLLPGMDETFAAALAAGAFAAFLSGAGPTLAAICLKEDAAAVRTALGQYATPAGQVLELESAPGYSAIRPPA
jgi:homoserine kinase